MDLHITPVESARDLKQFIQFPWDLYRDEPNWSPPLRADEPATYHKDNPSFAGGPVRLFLARDGNQVIGRTIAYMNPRFNSHFKVSWGHFGAFECIDSQEVATALLQAGEDWLRSQGAVHVRGPIHPVAELWGFLVEGHDSPNVFLTPWTPAYYDRLVAAAGYQGVKDLLAYEIDDTQGGFRLADRYQSFYRHYLEHHPDFSIRPIRRNQLVEDAEHIWRLTNASLLDNWGYMPETRETMLDMVQKMKIIVSEDAIFFVEYRGEPVAYAFGHPDINPILRRSRGSLWPTAFLELLNARHTARSWRLFGLAVLPEWHGQGLDALLFIHLAQALGRRRIRLEANWVLEDNVRMNNSLRRLGMRQTKRYRMYEKALV